MMMVKRKEEEAVPRVVQAYGVCSMFSWRKSGYPVDCGRSIPCGSLHISNAKIIVGCHVSLPVQIDLLPRDVYVQNHPC